MKFCNNSFDSEELKNYDINHLWHPYTQMLTYQDDYLMISRAEGYKVYDSNDNEYIDGISGLWNVNAGHKRKEIIEAIYNQLNQVDFYALNGFSYESAVILTKKLIDISPENIEKVFYCNGGSEANETAIKMARAYWKIKNKSGKYKIISLNGAWHGGTLGALSASHISSEKKYFEPMATGFIHIPQPNCYHCSFGKESSSCDLECAKYLSEVINFEDKDTIAAFMAEPIQGVGGVIIPPEQYWPAIKRICDENNILLIIDEVATGFGRTGTTFAITQWGIESDMIVCAKGITSGYLPLSAVMTTEEISKPFMEDGKYFQHGYTTGGHPASCAAAIANIDLMLEEGLLEQTDEKKNFMLNQFKELEKIDIVGNVRGKGFMVAVELVTNKETKEPYMHIGEVCKQLRKNGVIVRAIGNSIPFFPPLIITEEEIVKVYKIYESVLNKLCH